MFYDNKIWLADNQGEKINFNLDMLNRHGLISGATGTGKTITLKVLAESLSQAGIPVFLADVKGDLASLLRPGENSDNMIKRRERFDLNDEIFHYQGFPVNFWDLYGKNGIPVRTTISEMGPVMLSRIMGLNETQEGVLSIIFRVADDQDMLLLDIKDLRAMLNNVSEHAADYRAAYGNISPSSVGAIARNLLKLEDAGGNLFFGEPALEPRDFFQQTSQAMGIINVLDAQQLFMNPLMYSTFLLWLVSELFEILPEVGDLDKPRLVFFFDEAHLLFDGMPKALLQKITQVIKLIRSKGVGVFFITQNPADVPEEILAQLGNKVQHALRAYTPAEQKAVRAAAYSYRANPEFDTAEAITQLGTGEALISPLNADGKPAMVKRCFVLPPQSQFGALDQTAREQQIKSSTLYLKYAATVDRESAYERLTDEKKRADAAAAGEAKLKGQQDVEREAQRVQKAQEKEQLAEQRQETARLREEERQNRLREQEAARKQREEERARNNSVVNRIARSAMSSVVSSVGRGLARGILGSLKRF